jgi:hypothetical protein
MANPTAHYTFLPWYRTGLASAIDGSPAAGARGEIKVKLKTKVGATDGTSAERSVRLIGPGDIIGIDPRAVVRLDPRQFANDFEPNYLAAIEFFDEDFAWRYSPRGPEGAGGSRLIPWLSLLVFEDAECLPFAEQGEGFPRAITVKLDLLPPADDLWAWAHTHLNATSADPANPRATADMLAREPMRGCCRVVAARRLRPNTSYRAVLVPSFEAGRVAGVRGATPVNPLFAWGGSASVTLPVYFEWAFQTGEQGDFESLARRLNPVRPDPTVGRRPMNMSRPLPGMTVPAIRNGDTPAKPLLDLEGALQIPAAKPSAWEATSRKTFQQWLAEFINLGEAWAIDTSRQVAGGPALPNGIKLPIVLPPSYGRWHANIATLEPAEAEQRWLEQLNLDPRNRVAAAFGTLVIQKNQEDFMARSWAQYGELFRANRFRYRAQLMREMLTATTAKHLAPLAEPRLLATTQLAHVRVKASAQQTVHGLVASSALPVAAVQPAMRRMLRGRGPIAARFGARAEHLQELIRDVASTRVSLAPTWAQPAERLSLASRPAGDVPSDQFGWIGDDWKELRARIEKYLAHTLELADRIPELRDVAALLRRLLARGDAQAVLSAGSLTPQAVADVRGALEWIPPLLTQGGGVREEDRRPSLEDPRFSFAGWGFRQAAMNATELLTLAIPEPAARPGLELSATAKTLRSALSPYATVSERVDRIVDVPPSVKVATYDPLEAIVAYPKFADATYDYLKKISEEYVVPNLSKIPNNSVTLLEANWRFVESFLVGLNHEMGRELLWRGFRTDQRGTCFAQFWDIRGIPGGSADVHPIHGWKRGGKLTVLGENRPEGKVIKNNLVLVVRGDLLRRYPNTLVYAVKAVPNDQPRQDPFKNVNRRPADEDPSTVKDPVLFAKFEPDIYCFGFDLEKTEARGRPVPERTNLGWYFVLAERFGEPRFGLDDPKTDPPTYPQPSATRAADLTWAHLVSSAGDYAKLHAIALPRHQPPMPASGFQTDAANAEHAVRRASWNTDAAEMAAILLQTPFRLFFHANDMLLP